MSDSAGAVDTLFSHAYEELRRLASAVRRGGATPTLNPTALVHEAWLRLARSPGLAFQSEQHFKHIAARAMRRVLVGAARARKAAKRGGGAALVTFDEALSPEASAPDDVLALDEALATLTKLRPRQAAVVESRFFGGLEVAETAKLLGISEATVLREWRAARAWLALELRKR
jgi:RNA polymerase sigma factor (TIGR02999 family)